MLVRGEERKEGIGTHSPSLISYDLPEGIVGFEAEGAIDDGGFSQGCGSTVTFEVHTAKPSSVERRLILRTNPGGVSAASCQLAAGADMRRSICSGVPNKGST